LSASASTGAKYGRGGDRRSNAFRVQRADELGIRPDQVRGRMHRFRRGAAGAAAAAAAAGLPVFRLEDAPPWPPATNADTAPGDITLFDAPPELDFLAGDGGVDDGDSTGGGCTYSYDDVAPDGADPFAAILAHYRPTRDGGGDAAAGSAAGGSAASAASGGSRRKRVRFGGDAGAGAGGTADDSDDDASPSFGGPGGAGSKPLRVPACPLRLIVNKAPLADGGMWATLNATYFRGVNPRDVGLVRAAHRLAVRESLWQLRTAPPPPPPPPAAVAAAASTAAASSSPMLEDGASVSDGGGSGGGGGGGDTPLLPISEPGSSPRAAAATASDGAAGGVDADDGGSGGGATATLTQQLQQQPKQRGGWKGDPILRDAVRARERHAAELQKLALRSPARSGGSIGGSGFGVGATPQPSPLVSVATSPSASPSVLSIVANGIGATGGSDMLPLPTSPSAVASMAGADGDGMVIDGLDDGGGSALLQPPQLQQQPQAPVGPRTRRLAGIERLTSSLFATADVAALAATAEDALLPRGIYDGGLGVASLGSASSVASGSAASSGAASIGAGGGLGGFAPSRGASFASSSADGAAAAGSGGRLAPNVGGAGLTPFQRKVEQQLTISWRQLGPQAAANSVRLATLLGRLEAETSLQALFAQMGRHLAPVAESAPALAVHGLTRFLPRPEAGGDDETGGGGGGGGKKVRRPPAEATPAAAPPPSTIIPPCVTTDADGVPLPPATTAAGALLPATDGRLENAYWALAGPRCELGYSAALLSKRSAGSSWRFAADGGALAATAHRPVPASAAGVVSVPARALPTSASVATAAMRGGALDAFDACLAPMACERYVHVVAPDQAPAPLPAAAAVSAAGGAASRAAAPTPTPASAPASPNPATIAAATTDIQSQPKTTTVPSVASAAAAAATATAAGGAALAAPSGGAGKTLLTAGGRPRRARGRHGGVWLPKSALDAAAIAEKDEEVEDDDRTDDGTGAVEPGDEEDDVGDEDEGEEDDEGGDGSGSGDTSEDEEEEKRQRLGNAYLRQRPAPFPTAPLLMPGVANAVVSWGPPVETLLPQLRPRPTVVPPPLSAEVAAGDDGSAPPAAKRARTDSAAPSSMLQLLAAGGSDDEGDAAAADGGSGAAAAGSIAISLAPAAASSGGGSAAAAAAITPGGKLTRAGLNRLKGRPRVDARRRELLRCALAASDAVFAPTMLSVVVPSPTSLAAALAAAVGDGGVGFRPTVTRTPSAQSTRALSGGGGGAGGAAATTVYSFPDTALPTTETATTEGAQQNLLPGVPPPPSSASAAPSAAAASAAAAAPAASGPVPGAVRSTEMPLDLDLAPALPHAATVRWLLADCARAAGLAVPETTGAVVAGAGGGGSSSASAATGRPLKSAQPLPALDVEAVITTALSSAATSAVGLAASTALDDDLAWFASTVPLGTVVESRDSEDDWCLAVVVGEARDAGAARRHVRVHYAGWDSTADDWLAVGDGRLAPLGAHLPLTR
jgi:hypothetical protein